MSNKIKNLPIYLIGAIFCYCQVAESIYSPLIPRMVESLNISRAFGQWTMTSFLIGFALGMLSWGSLSDKIGRKPAFHIGYSIFFAGAILCLFSENITLLLIGRMIEAFGISAGSILPQTMVRDVYVDDKSLQTKVFSIMVIYLALSPLVGPLIGGYIGEFWSWHATFVAILIGGSVIWSLAGKFLPETRPSNIEKTSILRVARDMSCNPLVWGGMLIVACSSLGMLMVFYAEGPFLFVKNLGLSTGGYGWYGTGVAIPYALGALIVILYGKRLPLSTLLTVGAWITFVGALLWLVFAFTNDINISHHFEDLIALYALLSIVFFGAGIVSPIAFSHALKDFKEVIGTAGSIFGAAYFFIAGIVTFIVGLIHFLNATFLFPMVLTCLALVSLFSVYKLVRPTLMDTEV